MDIAPFAIEEFYARYEFDVPYNLSASDCQTMAVAELLELAGQTPQELGSLTLGYTESQGHPRLRAAIAATYQNVGPEEVVVLGAPEEGIYLTMRTLLSPGDEVVVMGPAYGSLRNLAEHICGEEKVKMWMVQPRASQWRFDVAELEALLTPQTRLLIVNFPHNPTGYLPGREEFQAIVDLARHHNVWLFCDEMYRGLERDPAQRLPSAADLYARSIVLAGLSKVHGLPGLRCGWLVVADEPVRAQLVNWKHYTTICAPAPSEYLAMAGLAAQEALIARNRALVAQNLQTAGAFFARQEAWFTWRPPQAGSVALVGVNAPSAGAFCDRLIASAGVLLLPGTHLGYDDRHVRFGLGRADFAQNLGHLEAYLEQQPEPGA